MSMKLRESRSRSGNLNMMVCLRKVRLTEGGGGGGGGGAQTASQSRRQIKSLFVFYTEHNGDVIRCLGRAGENSRGCHRQVTRRRMASCGEALGERSEDTAELSVDTRRGKQRRSRHTCRHTTTTTQYKHFTA
ncbi:hypothetical protein INR49_010145 [Caranx melampygus]|nr:hypothetical protein INR49_010145 [Caranx melampygus]